MNLRKIIEDTWTIAEKQIALELRFKISFFSAAMIGPVMRIVPFLFLYSGFFVFTKANNLGIVTKNNFIVFLLLGMLADVFIELGYKGISSRFLMEKYWQTIEGLLVAPVNRLSLIFGMGLGDLIASIPSILLFTAFAFLLLPIGLVDFGVVFIVLLFMLAITLSVGLVYGAVVLINENLMSLFEYGRAGWIFLSCLYYPITIFSPANHEGVLYVVFSIIEFFAKINPLYQGNNAIRTLWLSPGAPFPFLSMLYIIGFVILAPLIAILIFNKALQRAGMQGY